MTRVVEHQEADPLADWPDRTSLADEAGVVTLVFSASESAHDGTPWADGVWVPGPVSVDRAVALALHSMPGWLLSTSDAGFATALLAAGASERRHAHVMSHPLDVVPVAAVEPLLRIEPLTAAQVDRHARQLGSIRHRAYPPEHPDAVDGGVSAAALGMEAVSRGDVLGPLLPQSRIALVGAVIAGACLVVDREGTPPYGGPWVLDLFRDPACPVGGVGTALLCAALAAALDADLPGLSLAVSQDNSRAGRLYAHLGFIAVEESWTLALPAESEHPSSVS